MKNERFANVGNLLELDSHFDSLKQKADSKSGFDGRLLI